MKRIFSGAMSPEFPAPPKFFQRDSSSPGPASPKGFRSRSSSITKIFTSDSSPKSAPVTLPQETSTPKNLSPELVPIVTLLSAHAHRRYHEGVFLILQDLKGDGSPAARKWQEVYGVLIGTQLALWDAKELAGCDVGANSPRLKDVASKPHYINFTDATLRALNGSDAVVTESKKKLENALVVSTTLKNRYFLQFSDKESFNQWHAAIRLSLFECTSLQEAYTGAFLSSRGAKLGDIKIILADSKFDYEDWVSVRFGTGMPWKRCFAVISQGTSKKHPFGKINFYENDKKTKKAHIMATVVSSKALYAVYPSSPMLIDTSTIIKLEGKITFNKKEEPQETNIFVMPEKHHAVPGYDTIIRFLIPAMNAFKLYGRPKRLIANKEDQNSLLFALPTLPHVHYLKVDELLPLANSVSSLQWTAHDWRDHIRELLQKKLGQGYTGCGSSSGLTGALASPVIGSAELFEGSGTISSPTFLSLQRPMNGTSVSTNSNNSESISTITSKSGSPLAKQNYLLAPSNANKSSSDLASNTSSYSARSSERYLTPQGSDWRLQDSKSNTQLKVEIPDSNFDRLGVDNTIRNRSNPVEKYSNGSDLSALYDKYSVSPFGKSPVEERSPVPQSIELNDRSPYEQYVGSSEAKTFEISNIRDSTSTTDTNRQTTQGNLYNPNVQHGVEETRKVSEFADLAKGIDDINIEARTPGPSSERERDRESSIDLDLNFNTSENGTFDGAEDDDANVFDPDFMEQNQMLENESRHNATDSRSSFSDDSYSQHHVSQETMDSDQQRKEVPSLNVNHADGFIPHSVPVTDFQQYQNGSSRTPETVPTGPQNSYKQPPAQGTNFDRSHGPRGSPFQRQGYAMSSPNRPPGKAGISPQYPQFPNQGYRGPPPSRPMHPQRFHQQAPQSQVRPYPQQYQPNYPQQQFPNQGGSYNQFNHGPPPQHMLNMGAPASKQPMKSHGGRAGPYPHPGGINGGQKPRPPPSGGFSQFMPSTTTNPYSR